MSPTMEEILLEAVRAMSRHGEFASMHEAYGVLAEEVAELFDEVRRKDGDPMRLQGIRREAIQVAAVALRLAEQLGRDH